MKIWVLACILCVGSILESSSQLNATYDLNLFFEENDKKHPLLKWKYKENKEPNLIFRQISQNKDNLLNNGIESSKLDKLVNINFDSNMSSKSDFADSNKTITKQHGTVEKYNFLEDVILGIDELIIGNFDSNLSINTKSAPLGNSKSKTSINPPQSEIYRKSLSNFRTIIRGKSNDSVIKEIQSIIENAIFHFEKDDLDKLHNEAFFVQHGKTLLNKRRIYFDTNHGISDEYFSKKNRNNYDLTKHLLRYDYLLADSFLENREGSYSNFVREKSGLKSLLTEKNIKLFTKLNGFENKCALALDISPEMVAGALPSNACLITFFRDSNDLETFANILTWKGELKTVSCSLGDAQDLLSQFNDQIIKPHKNGIDLTNLNSEKNQEKKALKALSEIYEIVMFSIIKNLPDGTDTLIISTSPGINSINELQEKIPFPILFDRNPFRNLSVSFSKYSNLLVIFAFGYILLKQLKEKITHQKAISLKEGIVLRTNNKLIRKIQFNTLSSSEIFWILLGGGSLLIIGFLIAVMEFTPEENLPKEQSHMILLSITFFSFSIWSIIHDTHWVKGRLISRKKRFILYLIYSVLPQFLYFLFLVTVFINTEKSESPNLKLILVLTTLIIILWRITVLLSRRQFHKKIRIISAIAFVSMPILTWASTDIHLLNKFFRILPFQPGEFLIQKFDILYVQTGRDILEKTSKWEKPNRALSFSIGSEMINLDEDGFISSMDKVLSDQKVENIYMDEDMDWINEKPQLITLYQPTRKLYYNLFDNFPGLNLEGPNCWMIFGGWGDWPSSDYSLSQPLWTDQKRLRIISKHFQNFSYSLWYPKNEISNHGFLAEFYKHALLTGNAPRAMVKVQREKILNSKNRLSAIVNYGGYRTNFRGTLPE